MLQIKTFIFNPFQENTYLLYDETNDCVIIDAGMLFPDEKKHLADFVDHKGIRPVKMLQTHLHLDHLFGCSFINHTYGLLPQAHPDDLFFLDEIQEYARQFGIEVDEKPPVPEQFLSDGDQVTFGNTTLDVRAVPGHSPGGIVFYHPESKSLFAGDALFQGSVGRSDLPGGNHELLISGIHQQLMTLSDEVVVYSGHGPVTTIGQERINNPFLL